MNTLAKLMVILCIPMFAMCSNAQTRVYSEPGRNNSSQSSEFSRAELDQILAPIALYPDTVLSHILIASTYPLEVVQADRWVRSNSHLRAEAAVDAVDSKDWDPSVKALVAFPEILHRMSDDLDWTQRLGDAFLADEAQVTNVIQDLRQKAYASGNLEKMKYVTVQRDERIIIIEPSVEREVYIPYYDPRVVYGGWWWPDYPPVYWRHPSNHVYVSGFYWGPRVTLGYGFYSSSFLWHQRRVVCIDRPHYLPHLPRPVTSRRIAHYEGAQHWRHDPIHRRGLAYRSPQISDRYTSRRPSFYENRENRGDNRNVNNHLPQSRRYDGGSSHSDKRVDLRPAGGRHNSVNTRDVSEQEHRPDSHSGEPNRSDRADVLRDRLRKNTSAPAREWGASDRATLERTRVRNEHSRRSEGDRSTRSESTAAAQGASNNPDSGYSNNGTSRRVETRDPTVRTNVEPQIENRASFSRRVSPQNQPDSNSSEIRGRLRSEGNRAAQVESPRVERISRDDGGSNSTRRTDSPRQDRPNRESGGESKSSLRDRLERH